VPIALHDRIATLTGTVTVDDAEAFAAWLRTTDEPGVDLRDCTRMHTAILQAIVVFQPMVIARPADTFLAAIDLSSRLTSPSSRG
jgi:hypothetical protein